MKIENKFYLVKEITAESLMIDVIPDYTYNLSTGEEVSQSGSSAIFKHLSRDADRIFINVNFSNSRVIALTWRDTNDYAGYEVLHTGAVSSYKIDYNVPKGTKYIAFVFEGTSISHFFTIGERCGYVINPHYKQLKKKYSKENNQVFFRESLDGKINLFGDDYLLVKNASLEETLYFYVLRDNNIFASASFNKSDCKFDHIRKGVELKFTYNDKYSKILDAYENTYDLIKLTPALTPITLTKRCVVQIYIQGEKTLSNYAGGTYWETDVDEQVDDEKALTRKYHFSKGPRLVEVDLQGFNYDINAAYRGLSGDNIWNATSKREVGGVVYKMPCSIKFNKIHSANEYAGAVNPGNVKILSTGSGNGTYQVGDDAFYYKYDTYRIEIYTGRDGTGTKIYRSDYLYGKNGDFTLAVGEGLYPMSRIEQPIPQMDPTPNTFNLGAYVIEYQVWGRLLCDVDQVPSHEQGHEGEMINTYDLPRDDFATPRRNYRKCIGLRGFDSANSVVTIWQNEQTIESPTSYGMNDFGEYFVWPYTSYSQYFYPLARSSWANVSLWVKLGGVSDISSFETLCAECYKEYSIKDTYHIGDAIKALLAKIDPSIKHEKTAEYSSFLYGHTGGTASVLGNCDLYITQKTNILKGEYDQAAQKAEIKFKQLMDMLRDCFRCFWYIDDQNRFRIEHISYFMKGLSYNSPVVQFDLTTKKDKFNKKAALYCQQEVEYDKSDLISRYEFKYMDDVTKAMGGDLYVDVNNKYIQKDKTEEINIDGFTADIDYMLFLPDDFSNDGFALIMADSNKKVPIVNQQIKDEKQYNHTFEVYAQNWYASFNELAWHYMEDISGNNISNNNISLYPGHVKRCMKHNVEFPSSQLSIDVYKLITTDIGNGYIEEVTSNIDTDMTEIELRYEPN